MHLFLLMLESYYLINMLITPLTHRNRSRTPNPEGNGGNVVAFFDLDVSASAARAAQLLDDLPTRSREDILANMR
jgi:hypothetical protein